MIPSLIYPKSASILGSISGPSNPLHGSACQFFCQWYTALIIEVALSGRASSLLLVFTLNIFLAIYAFYFSSLIAQCPIAVVGPTHCWIITVIVDILGLFLILEKVFLYHYEVCLLIDALYCYANSYSSSF